MVLIILSTLQKWEKFWQTDSQYSKFVWISLRTLYSYYRGRWLNCKDTCRFDFLGTPPIAIVPFGHQNIFIIWPCYWIYWYKTEFILDFGKTRGLQTLHILSPLYLFLTFYLQKLRPQSRKGQPFLKKGIHIS